jgi:3-dehydroquinate synthase
MQTFRVELGPAAHPVHIGAGLLDDLGTLARKAGVASNHVMLVTDSNVELHYAARVIYALRRANFLPETAVVPAGESSKSFPELQRLYDRMSSIDRGGAVFALGGGVVGDLAGFAAATYLRGVAVIQVPTSLVAQVDSSLGGKTGINHWQAKNLIGAFHQPRAIIVDVDTLRTLPDREFREGLAEVIKYAAIMDAPMVADLERDIDRILTREAAILETMVARSLRHKAAVVVADEREGGPRKTLNFGHTVGHALETSAGYGSYLHGEAVAIGMTVAARLSERFAGLSADEGSRLIRLIKQAGLPTAMPSSAVTAEFIAALRLDKKRAENAIEFVLLEKLGKSLTRRLEFDQILATLSN